jgi:hypothetical protein
MGWGRPGTAGDPWADPGDRSDDTSGHTSTSTATADALNAGGTPATGEQRSVNTVSKASKRVHADKDTTAVQPGGVRKPR